MELADPQKIAGGPEEQDALLLHYEYLCYRMRSDEDYSAEKNEGLCGVIWDGIMCWPPASAGLSQLPCPTYLAGFRPEYNASKICEDGVWGNWTNFTQCGDRQVTLLVELGVNGSTFWENYVPVVHFTSELGYALSGVSLVIAFIILIHFKRLRCARNILHLHLFVSFIMRAFMAFLKRWVFYKSVGPAANFQHRNGIDYFHQNENGNWECKLLTTIWQYFIVANYSWVLMEGLYIHNVIMWALSADSNRIFGYIILGWGLPLAIVPSWAIARSLWDDELCWTVGNVTFVQNIIAIPTYISVVINFGLFVNILRLLRMKVRTSIQGDAQQYWRLAKSTLVLVVLFGVPSFVLAGLRTFANEQIQLVWLFGDQLFASFQGYVVALLYCFLNGEVQDELKKAWREIYNPGGVIDNNLPTTSCASWTSVHSHRRTSHGCSQIIQCLARLLTCTARPESRTSKRTETVDCIMCEACPHEEKCNGCSVSDGCQHSHHHPISGNNDVEMKLIKSNCPVVVSSPV